MTRLSVLFVNYNSWRILLGALYSLRSHPPTRAGGGPLPFEVIVVDNASPQRDADAEREVEELLAALNGRLVRHHENGGYSKGMNLAYAHCSGEWVLVTNPDVLFEAGCLDGLLRYAEAHPDCGAAAPEGFWDMDHEARLPPNILPTVRDLLSLTWAAVSPAQVRRYSRRRTRAAVAVWSANAHVELPMLSGCCFLIARATCERLAARPGGGPFDERFPLYFEDTDLSRRIRGLGLRIVQVHGSRLVHFYNRSGQTDHGLAMQRYWASRRLYYRKWYGAPGGWLYGATRRFLGSRWAQRRAQLPPHPIHELGTSVARPVIEMPAGTKRWLVEIALDPHFYLAAGVLGEGPRWTPGDMLFANLGPATFYFRVVDLTDDRQRQIGVYRYTRVYAEAAARSQAHVG
jgi:GT2 family glycosyltransferase